MATVFNTYDFRMSRLLREGKCGNFELKKKVIPKDTILNMYSRSEGRIFLGKYMFDYPEVTLLESGHVWMSDSQLEVESMVGAIELAKGDVLIGGLGIGLLPTFIKGKKSIKKIDIVEKNQEVIDLAFNQIATNKMSAINDDIFHYLKTTSNKYDFIHIDIWSSICAPFDEIDKTRDLAKRCLKHNGTTWCWLQELYDRIKAKLPKEPTLTTSPVGYHEPCLICGKTFRNDYAGLCLDCADALGVSEMFMRREK